MVQNRKLKIIDPHIHFWNLSFGRNTWLSDRTSDLLGSLAPINRNYLKEDYLEDSDSEVDANFVFTSDGEII